MKYKSFLRSPAALVSVIVLTGIMSFSCTDFFSSSWFPWAARDINSMIPAVTVSNVKDLVQQFGDSTDGSYALLKKIQTASDNADGADLDQLRAAALEAAVNAVGLGQAAVGAASNLKNLQDIDEIPGILQNAMDSLPNLENTGSILSSMLPDPNDDKAAFDSFTDAASTDDLAMAAAVLILGEVSKASDGNISDFLSNPPPISEPTRELAQAMAIVAVLSSRPDTLSDDNPLTNILDYLNLLS